MSIVYKERAVSIAKGGYSKYFHKWDINLSSILDILINEAAKCTHYASDLFIFWKQVEESLCAETETYPTKRFFFGFRDMGVDHLAYINFKYDPDNIAVNPDYRCIYMLKGELDDESEFRFTLYEIEVIGFKEEEAC